MAQRPLPSAPLPDPPRATARPFRPPHPERQVYAALDLGTNNCRLLIARPDGHGGFVVMDAFSRIVRLGEGLAASGRLSEAAMDRAVAALGICADKVRRRHVGLVRSVATEACRQAENGAEFVARVHEQTGLALEVITPEQEAGLAVLGCFPLLEAGEGPALVFDIGGGSTELVLVDTRTAPPRMLAWHSAPWGVVSLSESDPHVGADEGELRAAYQRMRERVEAAFTTFAPVLDECRPAVPRLLGTSGTVTTLASLHLGLASYDRNAVDGLHVPAMAMRAISERLAGMDVAARMTLPCIGAERADLVVAGCAILDVILDLWPAARLGVADRGIREGILRSLMAGERLAR